ncbi:NADH-quinone oxidoreductase subunit NuoG [Casimicrobium huifangae]|jgi:NADH-quinone oxidoreductase subunit G|uniref:NADH-quinone oxidoreductase subunit NuoG n=1 Tax=Casimicrobium huifangae TaxID=2591109 RepID=UPI002B78D904|nr:NADH-quinone oxidoreductase subunit NuoG [Casimicrobium huifangae]HQA34436.1 NADH-quinone oxidoreductase subunit NuoG [Casimicrobium huifangae]
MLNIEIDGKAIQVSPGSTVMDAANQVGAYVPHFCYHKKLSIAANCRMCLVQVEKAPKPLPACATPVTEGMKVFTASEQAKKAQQGVMEFLLINHPLDCPICDQGGECQLQDLSVGYGKSASRYTEEKRVVFHKNLGPLISAEEMSRCIHCTRCVRFGQEIAGVMELGMGGRGEHSEILSFVGKSIDSELSGNMIDVCPVGALTSKPFRYSARTWELQRRKSVSPHDGLNANLQVQIKGDRVMRVLPRENEAVNECWISDRDRFSYEGLYADDRLTSPMIKHDGVWQQASWQDALNAAAGAIGLGVKSHGAAKTAFLLGPHTTLEEASLAKRLATHLGGATIDHRLRVTDSALDQGGGIPWLGFKLANIAEVDRFLVIGSSLRQEQPLLAQRIRQRVKKGALLSVVGSIDDDLLCPVAAKVIVKPSGLWETLCGVLSALAKRVGKETPISVSNISASEEAIAASLASGKRVAVLIGDMALSQADASHLESLAFAIANMCGGSYGRLALSGGAGAAYVAGAFPTDGAATAREALGSDPANTFVLVGCEPERDSSLGAEALEALGKADKVVCLTSFASDAMKQYADVLLPIAPFTETSGTYVSNDGTVQSFAGVVRPLGETRPGWKVLRVLGDLLEADFSSFNSSEDVRNAALTGFSDASLGARIRTLAMPDSTAPVGLERVADVPIYHSDALARRGQALATTSYGKQPRVRLSGETASSLSLTNGARVKVTQAGQTTRATVAVDNRVPPGSVRIPLATEVSAALGNASAAVTLEAV